MPFTFSHPAIVLPLSKLKVRGISTSALIIGSVTPDFEYFIRMKLTGRYSHSIEGMFLLDLPVAAVLFVIFHGLVRKPLINNLPFFFQTRLAELYNFDFKYYLKSHYLMFVICLLAGIFSHIVWDSFTHANSYFTDKMNFLSHPVKPGNLPQWPLFRYLQHISTTIGALVIIVWFASRVPAKAFSQRIQVKYWMVFFLVAIIAFVLRALVGFEYFGDQVATGISASCIGLIVAGIICRHG